MAEARNQEVLTAMYSLALDAQEGASHRIQAARVFLSYEAPLEGDLEVADNLFAALQNSVAIIDSQRAIASAVIWCMDNEPDREWFLTREIAEAANVEVEWSHSAQIEVGKLLTVLGLLRERIWLSEDGVKRWVYRIPEERDDFRENLLGFNLSLGG